MRKKDVVYSLRIIQFNPSVPVLWIKADIWLVVYITRKICCQVQFIYRYCPTPLL
ncbi:hypothetical protein ACQCT9_16250 [Sutcliffiella horikoshii]